MELLVLGGGPAGTTAALQGRELGADVTLVEARRLGGTSLNHGPAPIRTLARAARLVRDSRSWERFGLRGDPPQVDMAAALGNAGRVADEAHEQRHLADLARGYGIDVVDQAGPARFVDQHTVQIPDGRTFRADAVVVAVGGHPGRLPIPGSNARRPSGATSRSAQTQALLTRRRVQELGATYHTGAVADPPRPP